jgi:putative ABC transport system permease protein
MTGEEQLTHDLLDEELDAELAAAAAPPSSAKRKMAWLQVVAFILGLGLLFYVIRRVGLQPIFDALLRVGWGFFIIVAINGLRHVIRTAAMRLAIPAEHRNFSFRHALAVRLGGETVSFLTFTGPLLGEATKAALLKRRVPLAHGVSALVVDNILYNFSVAAFVLSGALVMLFAYRLPAVVNVVLIAIAASVTLGILITVLAANRRVMLLSWTIDRLNALGLKLRPLQSKRDQINRLETDVYSFYRERRASFFIMLGLNFLAHATSVAEVYVGLRLLDLTASAQAAYIIESLTKVINFVFGFVPGTVGVYEGGTALIMNTLGYTAAVGVTLALVRKAAIVVWTGIGMVILAWRTVPHGARRLSDKSPALRKVMDSLVFSNITHRPVRTLVSIIGIGIGVLLIVFTVGLAHGLLRERGKREGNVKAEIMVRPSGTVGLAGSDFGMPVTRAAEIARVPGVAAAVPLGQNFVSNKGDNATFGGRLVDGIEYDQYAPVAGMTIISGRKLGLTGDEAIVDATWLHDRKLKLGDTFEIYERPFTVVGVYEPPNGGRIKIPLATMQEQLGGQGKASAIMVSCVDPTQQEEVAQRLINALPPDQFQILFTKDLPEIYASGASFPALNVFLNVMVAVAAAISLLVVLLAMYTTVTERTRQIGILKSLGMSSWSIAWVIEQEAALVSVLGVATGVGFTLLARLAVMRLSNLQVEIETRWLLIALAVGLLGGTIGAMYPAWRAARQDAVDALSYE